MEMCTCDYYYYLTVICQDAKQSIGCLVDCVWCILPEYYTTSYASLIVRPTQWNYVSKHE